MLKRSFAALTMSAALSLPTSLLAQPPEVDASFDSAAPAAGSTRPAAQGAASSSAQNELFSQLQILQQEVMQLRGLVEQQSYELQQLKQQNMERYIDLDRRMAALASAEPAAAPAGAATATAVVASSSKALPGEKEAYEKAYRLVTSKQFDKSLEAFKQFLLDYPDGKYSPNSYYWLGELYQVVQPKDLEASRQAFQQLVDRYPEHPKAPDAMYKLGKVQFQLGNAEAAKQTLQQMQTRYADSQSPSLAKAQQFLSDNF